ncbi:MAG: hypothetical protein ABJL55_16380 [Roseibium sp.]
MSVSTLLKIGDDEVDLNAPCDVVTALRKVQLIIVTGGKSETIELAGDRVTFSQSNASRLEKLIQHYDTQCRRSSGKRVRRAARTARWV